MSTIATDTADGGAKQFHVTTEDHPVNGVQLGFWFYLMSDCFVFISLFACYAVYGFGGHYAGGPIGAELFNIPMLAVSTAALLLSSMFYGFGMLGLAKQRKAAVIGWLAVAGGFALIFLGLEVAEFSEMIAEGAGPQRSAFLSSFFTLVGTHGLHVTVGMIWLTTLLVQVVRHGLTADNVRRLTCLSLYWHFLDLVWIGIFSFVYLIGVL